MTGLAVSWKRIMVKTHRSNDELIPHKVNGRLYAIVLVTNFKS